MEDLGIFCFLFYHLKDNVRLSRLRDLHSIVLLVIQVDAVFVVTFTHLAAQWSPLYTYAVLGLCDLQLLS